ncbi:MAG TPA: Fe-S protein assembly co-chaperone HscB [Chitinophagaceae bacterium]|nr:Fe-S protein assembly co-chaperone HscB [Chitinophagaceae bacterium]
MNYFELFDIPVQLAIDKKSIPKKYFELSRLYHPDLYANAAEDEKALMLEKTTLLNKAFKTFQQSGETIKYVLELKGLLVNDEKYQLPASFLMEVMELNEALADSGTSAEILNRIDQLESEIYEPVKEIVEGYQEGITSKKELLQVKEYYFKKKYLDRIKHQLNGMA